MIWQGGEGFSAHVVQEPAYIYLKTQRSFSSPFIGALTISLYVFELYNDSKQRYQILPYSSLMVSNAPLQYQRQILPQPLTTQKK